MVMYNFIVCVAVLFLLPAPPIFGKKITWSLDSIRGRELELHLNAYYTALGYIQSLDESSIPRISTESEGNTYYYLARNLHKPRFFLMEISINPLPFSGVLIREHASGAWHRADVGERSNLLGILTAGFPEPGALSFFVGSVANFGPEDSLDHITGRGFGGALLSVGNYHIVYNRMVPDWWAEGEVKLKGTDIRTQKRLSWSIRTGTKIHSHPNIANTFYFAISRDRVDLKNNAQRNISHWLLRNSELEYRVDMNYRFRFTRYFLLAGKKFPAQSGQWTFSLGVGLLRQLATGYSGELARSLGPQWSLLVRPNVEF